MREKYREEFWADLEVEKVQLVSALLPCRCDNACELPGSHPKAIGDNQGFVNLAMLCVWHWREMLHFKTFLCATVSWAA